MECHDVRLLLTFAQRGCEDLDATERAALLQHLEQCPECASVDQSERRLDETLGQVMRDVPVPAALKESILGRLAAERAVQPRRVPWGLVAAASLLVVLLGGGVAWYFRPLPRVTMDDVKQFVSQGQRWDESSVEAYFAARGLRVKAPRTLDYRYLQHVDLVDFKGRRVPQLTFALLENDHSALAHVLILSPQQFRLHDLSDAHDLRDITSIRILHEQDEMETYLVFYRGEFEKLLRDQI